MTHDMMIKFSFVTYYGIFRNSIPVGEIWFESQNILKLNVCMQSSNSEIKTNLHIKSLTSHRTSVLWRGIAVRPGVLHRRPRDGLPGVLMDAPTVAGGLVALRPRVPTIARAFWHVQYCPAGFLLEFIVVLVWFADLLCGVLIVISAPIFRI